MTQRILIVDDKEQDRYMLQVMLTAAGYKVDAAPDGAKALAIAKQNPPSLIISDVLMPVMDGFTLCREWHKDPLLSSIPFVFYTATYTDPRDEDFALNLGADRFIVKPISPTTFLEIIKDLLTKYSELKDKKKVPSRDNLQDEGIFFKKYSEVLIRKLEDKLELFRIVFTTDPSPMFILSEKLRIIELNISAQKLIGIKEDEALDKDFIEKFIPKNLRADFKEKMEKVLDGEVVISLEVPIIKSDGVT
ncbi:MAG: response regulator, partial [Chitinispirillaceae bacterium]|nr:response regulator [Chitinispirillaceae bacterium]